MTSTPPEAPSGPAPDEGPRVSRDEIRDLGRLRRSATDRKVAGVAGGLARHLDIDPLVLRVAFVVLAFFGGAGLILYGALWLFVPDEETGQAPVTLDERSRTVALLIVGVLAAFALLGDTWGVFWFPWPLAIIAVVVLIVMTRRDRRHQPPPGAGGAPVAPPYAATYDAPATAAGQAPGYEYGASMYGWQGGGTATPPPAPAGYRPVPRDPRRRGPLLFWFTVALVVLGEGILGMVDTSGVAVADSAYPALAVGLVGVMLLVGAVFGRAGGLILLGLLATIGLVGTTAADEWDGDHVTEAPRTAAAVQPRYDIGAGELVLDLTKVTDLQALDGRTVHLEGGFARLEVILPDDVDAVVHGQVGGPGNISLFGDERDGIDTRMTRTYDGGADAPDITIDAEIGVGEIHVDTE